MAQFHTQGHKFSLNKGQFSWPGRILFKTNDQQTKKKKNNNEVDAPLGSYRDQRCKRHS